ncbi:MAG: hypothetical protein WBA74_02050 [Cyclobacteriaceae bacterium]
MNKKLIPYVDFAEKLRREGSSDPDIIDLLKDEGASLAIVIRTMGKLGLNDNEIDKLISLSKIWKDHKRDFGDLFFDFVELDDDLVDPN